MKRLLLLLAVAALLGGVTYYVCRHVAMTHSELCGMPMDKNAEMRWLRAEFKLTDAQYARISTLHEQYQPVCEKLCAHIADSNRKVAALIHSSSTVTPELAEALRESATVNQECRQALLGHVYAVSREMDPAQGRRYIDMMQQRIVQMGGN